MPARIITAFCRLRRVLPLIACAALPAVSHAAHEVPVFTVNVAAQTPAALGQAMRAAVVRATGHSTSAADPALAPLVADAQQYVLGYLPGPHGTQQVMFNGAAVDRVIRAAGLSVWSPQRPFTLVVLSPPPSSDEQSVDAAAIGQAAEARGLPISIVPLTVRDAKGRLLPAETLLSTAHGFNAEQLLIGHSVAPAGGGAAQPGAGAQAPPAAAAPGTPAPPSLWHWTLITPFIARSFTGSIRSGIDGTVELLAPPPGAAEQVSKVRVRIDGLATLPDYARVETMLAAVPGVSRSAVAQVDGTSALFDLWTRGGAAALGRLLAGSPRFKPIAGAKALAYRYEPPQPPAAAQ